MHGLLVAWGLAGGHAAKSSKHSVDTSSGSHSRSRAAQHRPLREANRIPELQCASQGCLPAYLSNLRKPMGDMSDSGAPDAVGGATAIPHKNTSSFGYHPCQNKGPRGSVQVRDLSRVSGPRDVACPHQTQTGSGGSGRGHFLGVTAPVVSARDLTRREAPVVSMDTGSLVSHSHSHQPVAKARREAS